MCVNERPPENPKGCCRAKGGLEIVNLLKQGIAQRHAGKDIKVTKSGCLGLCEKGVNMVVYPEGVWYSHVTQEDIGEIIEGHLLGGQPVVRLMTEEEAL